MIEITKLARVLLGICSIVIGYLIVGNKIRDDFLEGMLIGLQLLIVIALITEGV